MSKELIERLRALSGSRKPYPNGPVGQMVGMESYRIVANGFALECIDEAADRIEELERELSQIKESPTMQAVRDMIESKAVKENEALLADNDELKLKVTKFGCVAASYKNERDALLADNERLREALIKICAAVVKDHEAWADSYEYVVAQRALAATKEQE